MTRTEQFDIIDKSRRSLLDWAKSENVPLYRIEFVVPFVEGDFGLSVWFFLETDAQLTVLKDRHQRSVVEDKCRDVLLSQGYDTAWIPKITFGFDSHENVQKNYGGSYFYRLR